MVAIYYTVTLYSQNIVFFTPPYIQANTQQSMPARHQVQDLLRS